jgi:hypothetical protein
MYLGWQKSGVVTGLTAEHGMSVGHHDLAAPLSNGDGSLLSTALTPAAVVCNAAHLCCFMPTTPDWR